MLYPEEIMEQDRERDLVSATEEDDVLFSFSADAQKTAQTAASVDESMADKTANSRMAIGSRKKTADFQPFAEPIRPEEEDESAVAEDDGVIVLHEAESDPEPTARQIRRAERDAKKKAKWDKKDAKRKAKVERQQKNNTRIMLAGTIFLAVICVLMQKLN